MAGWRLDYEIESALEESLATVHAGVPGLVEAFRQTGAAAVVDWFVRFKTRKRGLTASQFARELLCPVGGQWAAGGERCEDLEHPHQEKALSTVARQSG